MLIIFERQFWRLRTSKVEALNAEFREVANSSSNRLSRQQSRSANKMIKSPLDLGRPASIPFPNPVPAVKTIVRDTR
jgi:hypothetical protein